jgi:DNA primase
MGIPKFIKLIDENIYNEYQLEKLKDAKSEQQLDLERFVEKLKKPVYMRSGILKGLKKVSQLNPDNPIKKFVVARKIPNEYHAKLFACPNFMHFVNDHIPDKFSTEALVKDETRLLIPFLDVNKSVHAFQGRSLRGSSKVKYITIILRSDVPKLYGLDTLDGSKRIYVVEGPLDSMFIPNSVATAGGDLVSAISTLSKSERGNCI